MNERIERLTPYAGLLGVALLVAAVSTWLVTREFAGPVQILTAIGGALTVFWLAGSLGTIRDAAGSRATRYGSNTLLAVAALIALVGLANFLANRYSTRWDLTRLREFTLSDQTTKVLASLKDPVKITAFYQQTDGRRGETEDLMKEYLVRTDKVSIEYVDPDAQPALARQLGIRVGGTLVFESGAQKTEVTSVTESSVTGALIKVSRSERKKIYLTNGNGELDSTSADRAGLSQAKSQLERLNYQVETLNLLTTAAIPTDAAVLVIAGPRRPFDDNGRRAIETYLQGGGRALILVDPRTTHGLESLLQKFGLAVADGIIIDPSSSLQGDLGTLVVQRYPFHQITRDLAPTVFPLAAAIERAEPLPDGLTVLPLAQGTDRGWLEKVPERVQYDDGTDVRGPNSVAQTVERIRATPGNDADRRAEGVRLIVVGDSDFAANQFSTFAGNLDFFLNSVNWLAEEEALISIAPKPQDETKRLVLTPIQQNLILFSSVIFLPAAVALAGASVWWQRR